ncbi:MAG: hydantoinase/oxoprolinase family protein [Ectothiorhodospiraceae bacterium]|nr:hydantoinase/oxoprolinase family protein [Ectothiorhodospiraceae bacterium]
MSERAIPGVRIGVDVGGTFTDVVCAIPGQGHRVLKVPSTPGDSSRGVMDGVAAVLAQAEVDAARIERFAHGTTVATNAVLERKGARIGLITTEGFRDVLEIGRQMRSQMYNVRLDPETPVFLAPGRMRRTVRERIGSKGEVLVPLDEASVVEAVDGLVADGAQSIAVALLFSFLDGSHEERVRDIVRERHPGLDVSLSCEVDPAFREYERTAVTAFDAYIKPVVDRYLAHLENGLSSAGVEAPLQVMQSRGGLANAAVARRRPIRLFLSGPAAGVIGAQAVGAVAGVEDLISVDIGGTSCDIALVSGSKPLIRPEGTIDGYPVRVPMIDVNAIGSGGGSIAWIDGAGGLRVGPHSAGSDPGPACYGRGGTAATVTDASIVLGYLDPAYFAGGALALDPELAHRAVERTVADPLGMSVHAAAAGIHRVLDAQMAEGIRLVSIRQGFDPRGFALVPLGGAGALHACSLADELGIRRIVVPRRPGVLSAGGLLAAPVEHEMSAAFAERLDRCDLAAVRTVLDGLDRQCEALMAEEGAMAHEDRRVEHAADVCYVGQGYHLEIPLVLDDPDPLQRLYRDFLAAHDRVYGHATEAPARFVNLRSVHRAGGAGEVELAETGDSAAPRGSRTIWLPGREEPVEAVVVRRGALAAGERLVGPAIVEQADTTILVRPGWVGAVSDNALLVLERTAEEQS